MTRDEVIKALSCCVLRDPDDRPRCGDCPYPSGSACSNRLKADALALLKQEPKHGNWIKKPYLLGTSWFCNLCGSNYGMPHETFNYCPNCGARMEEDHDKR